ARSLNPCGQSGGNAPKNRRPNWRSKWSSQWSSSFSRESLSSFSDPHSSLLSETSCQHYPGTRRLRLMRAINWKTRLLPFCLLLLISGCVTRKTTKLTAESKPVHSDIKPATLSDYIRTIYKLSSEASKATEERAILIAQSPELEPLVIQAEESPR